MTTPARNRFDFHCHSAASDGRDPPGLLYDEMRRWGLRVASVTDHDTLAGYLALRAEGLGGGASRAGRPELTGGGPVLVPGIEINAVAAPDEPFPGSLGERHFLGYGLDPDDPGLATTLRRQQALRRGRVEETVARLRELGMPVDEQLGAVLGPQVSSAGRPHVARAMIAAGYTGSVESAFRDWLARGRPAYVPRRGLGEREAIEAIRSAGGLAVLAHTADAPDIPAAIERLQGWGLGGLEVYYGGYARTFGPQAVARLVAFARARGLVATGGSDYHGDTMTYDVAQAGTWVPRQAAEALLGAIGWDAVL
ncbi:MAG: PHP domain-containing protein [Candidatus Limnocylindrales bacterium]